MAVYWNNDLDEQFRAMRLAKPPVPVADMAAHFGTTVAAIYARARILKAFVMERRPFTDREEVRLKEMAAAGATDNSMADKLGRTVGSIRWKLGQLDLIGDRGPRWSEGDYARLRTLVEQRKTMPELEAALGLSDTTIRKHLSAIGLAAARAKRVTIKEAGREQSKRGRPVADILPLTDNQLGHVKACLGHKSLRAIAAELGMGVKALKQRAKATGFTLDVSMRRTGEPLTKPVLAELAAHGLTVTEAGRRLARDGRTVAKAAAEFGIRFSSREGLCEAAHQARGTKLLAARAERDAKRMAAQAAREAQRREHCASMAWGGTEACTAMAHLYADNRALVAQEIVAQPIPDQDRVAKRKAAESVARGQLRKPKRPSVHTATPRPPADQPKVVHVMATPAPVRPATDSVAKAMVSLRRPRRWNDGSFAYSKPKVLLIQSEVDAAIARFIAERGVTKVNGEPVDEAVAAARRLGFMVLRDGEGFVLDGRIRLEGLADLQAFVRRREEARLPMSA